MKPYHITSNVFNSWVDLESIQMISELVLFRDQDIESGYCHAGSFWITLAFQEKQKAIEARTTLRSAVFDKNLIPMQFQTEGEKRVARWAQIRDEQAGIKKAYDDLLAAWKALDPENRST